jgi:hypothetical protein
MRMSLAARDKKIHSYLSASRSVSLIHSSLLKTEILQTEIVIAAPSSLFSNLIVDLRNIDFTSHSLSVPLSMQREAQISIVSETHDVQLERTRITLCQLIVANRLLLSFARIFPEYPWNSGNSSIDIRHMYHGFHITRHLQNLADLPQQKRP